MNKRTAWKTKSAQVEKRLTQWAMKQGLIGKGQKIKCDLRVTFEKIQFELIPVGPQPPLNTSISDFFNYERGASVQVYRATVTSVRSGLVHGHLFPGDKSDELRTVGDLILMTRDKLKFRRGFYTRSIEVVERMLRTAGLELAKK